MPVWGLRGDRSGEDAPADYYEDPVLHHAFTVGLCSVPSQTPDHAVSPSGKTLVESVVCAPRFRSGATNPSARDLGAGWHNGTVPTDSTDPVDPKTSATPADDDVAFDYPVTFRINRTAYFTVPMAALVVVLLVGASPWFAFALIVPVLVWLWIRRLRTVVTENGLTSVRMFSTTEIAWSDIAGLQFPKWSSVRAVLTDGSRVRLPAIGFRDLPALSLVSGGRIPDPFEAARSAE